ncbi:hypothetical protein BD324DRAFT_649357 [Kockovaella imperatae]|uniref:Uncharacterized protein n=1 Tax=Kockovaella imperatae TaxID=4999 RepID=A0A1Y1UP73_9TREE|nr:hypothetical protein BD324DRAFT_649357 [Kockovaella imperatae]ORX39276.1 hypothetical protein BD324DRAFT_649357 [Kockovaella imperatae]
MVNLDNYLCSTLRRMAIDRGMANAHKAKKIGLIQFLESHTEDAPEAVAIEPAPRNSQGPAPPQPDHIDQDGMHAMASRVAALETVIQGLADRLSQIAPTDTRPLDPRVMMDAFGAALSGIGATTLEAVMELAPHVSQDLVRLIASRRLPVWEFWRLDPEKVTVVQKARPYDPEQDQEQSFDAARTRYRTFGDILRPWLIYALVRDCLVSGQGRYLIMHLYEILRVVESTRAGPHKFASILNWHFKVVEERLNHGDDNFDERVWIRPDPEAINRYVTNYAPSPQRLPVTPETPVPQTNRTFQRPNLPWRAEQYGSLTSDDICHRYNLRQECPGPLCIFRHACSGCGKDLRPVVDCDCQHSALQNLNNSTEPVASGSGSGDGSGSGSGSSSFMETNTVSRPGPSSTVLHTGRLPPKPFAGPWPSI